MKLQRHIALIGYRASGKTSVAERLAPLLGCSWVDVDAFIEQESGRSIPEIFATDGEDGFRAIETACLARLCTDQNPQLISTGGGAVLRAENRRILQENCQEICYLAAPATVLAERLRVDAGDRPSLTGQAVADEVALVLEQRRPIYEALATQQLDATMPLADLVQHIMKIVEN